MPIAVLSPQLSNTFRFLGLDWNFYLFWTEDILPCRDTIQGVCMDLDRVFITTSILMVMAYSILVIKCFVYYTSYQIQNSLL